MSNDPRKENSGSLEMRCLAVAASSESLLKASDESSRKMHDRTLWDGRDGCWDGLGRTLGRIKCAKSPMFTGLGTVGRINWGGEGISSKSKHRPSLGSFRRR